MAGSQSIRFTVPWQYGWSAHPSRIGSGWSIPGSEAVHSPVSRSTNHSPTGLNRLVLPPTISMSSVAIQTPKLRQAGAEAATLSSRANVVSTTQRVAARVQVHPRHRGLRDRRSVDGDQLADDEEARVTRAVVGEHVADRAEDLGARGLELAVAKVGRVHDRDRAGPHADLREVAAQEGATRSGFDDHVVHRAVDRVLAEVDALRHRFDGHRGGDVGRRQVFLVAGLRRGDAAGADRERGQRDVADRAQMSGVVEA